MLVSKFHKEILFLSHTLHVLLHPAAQKDWPREWLRVSTTIFLHEWQHTAQYCHPFLTPILWGTQWPVLGMLLKLYPLCHVQGGISNKEERLNERKPISHLWAVVNTQNIHMVLLSFSNFPPQIPDQQIIYGKVGLNTITVLQRNDKPFKPFFLLPLLTLRNGIILSFTGSPYSWISYFLWLTCWISQ